MKTFYLLRHGPLSVPAGLYGTSDVPAQIEATNAIAQQFCRWLNDENIAVPQPVNRIISSPLARCLSLASSISQLVLPLLSRPLAIDSNPDFQEMHFGEFDGRSFDEIPADSQDWQRLEQFWQAPLKHRLAQAEALPDFQRRINRAWRVLLEHTLDSTTTLIVTHGGVIRMILALVLADDIYAADWYQRHRVDYGCLIKITVSVNQATVVSVNDMFAYGQSKVAMDG